MIELKVDQASVDRTVDYLEAVRQRIFAAVHAGMEEAMEGLAGEAINQLEAAGIHSRTGQLLENIGNSPRVTETTDLIIGKVKAEREMKLGGRTFIGYVGTALDEGFHVKAVPGHLYQFTEPDADTLFTQGHQAFDVKPHPFLKRAIEAYESPLMDIIRARVQEAIGGAAAV